MIPAYRLEVCWHVHASTYQMNFDKLCCRFGSGDCAAECTRRLVDGTDRLCLRRL